MFLMSIIARAALVMPTINSEMATAYRIERRIEVHTTINPLHHQPDMLWLLSS